MFLGLSCIAPEFAARLKRRILRKFFKKEIVRLDEWDKWNVRAGFTTRHFPVVLHKTDDLLNEDTQQRFRHTISAGAGFSAPTRYVFLNQVHGDNVQVLEGGQGNSAPGEFFHLMNTDGVITNIKGLTLLVFTADCLPIFLCAPPWIGLAHAGRRGTEKEIARRAFEAIREKSGCPASGIRVIFGPRISKNCYEVGEESGKKIYFDLAGENKKQLLAAGASAGRITDLDICTVLENGDFYSFRKEKEAAGRMISFISKF